MGLALVLFAVSLPARGDAVPHDGFYRGMVLNTAPGEKLPERVTLGLNTSVDGAGVTLTGAIRLYFGEFGSTEFTQQKVSQTNYNVLTRQIKLRSADGMTLALRYIESEGMLVGEVYTDALAQIGKILLVKMRR